MPIALGGCSVARDGDRPAAAGTPQDLASYLRDKPVGAHGLYAAAFREGPRNEAVNHLRAGLAAMELGALDAAAASFALALGRIGGDAGADAPAGVSLAAAVAADPGPAHAETDEAHERVMAHYYRGLLHLMAGDHGSARATFRAGTAGQGSGHDVGLLTFLEGWALHCGGDRRRAEGLFAEAESYEGALHEPEADHDLLLIAETGRSPVKHTDGSRPRFTRGEGFAEVRASFIVDGARIAGAPAEDVHERASARDRGFEAALVGDGAPGAGAMTRVAAFEPTTARTAHAADARYWDNLPDRIHLATLAHPNGPKAVTVRFEDAHGRTVAEKPALIVRQPNGCGIAWARSRSALDVPTPAPAGAVAVDET